MDFSSPFSTGGYVPGPLIKQDTEVIFVSDMFIDQYVGGAELTTEALIEKCPVPFQKVLA